MQEIVLCRRPLSIRRHRQRRRQRNGRAPQQQVPQRDVAILDGVLERVTFSNPETGYTIARIAPDRGTGRGPVSAGTELVTAVGPLLGAQIGESLRLRGRWTSHMKYGRQFEVHSYTTVLPATEQGIRRYLGSGLIKGIGPVMAERMVDHFGVDIMHIIDDEPGRLIEVPGLGPKRSTRIKDAWAEQKAIKEVMIFLQGVGVSTSLAVKIYKKYGDESVETVQQQPYQLASDVWGIGFKTADTIAASVGIAKDSPERIKAGLAYTLSEAADDGHCYLPEPRLVADAAKILGVPAARSPRWSPTSGEEGAVIDTVPVPGAAAAEPLRAVYLPPFFHSERSLATVLRHLLAAAGPAAGLPGRGLGQGPRLAQDAHRRRPRPRASRSRQAGPHREGRGADRRARMREELHRAFGGGTGAGAEGEGGARRPDRPRRQAAGRTDRPRGRDHPPPAEAPAWRRPGIRREQPPGRRPGRDRRDVDGRRDPRQQAGQGGPAGGAPAAGRGRGPAALRRGRRGAARHDPGGDTAGRPADEDLPPGAAVRHRRQRAQGQRRAPAVPAPRWPASDPDFFWFNCDETEATAELVADIVARRIPARFGLDPRRDVQVLCPMHRGPAGAGNLNLLLQEALTPYREGAPERRYGGRVFRVGDKVTQLRNNYDKGAAGVFNGTTGVVTGMSLEDHSLTVRTDEDEELSYDFDELDELAHAYAVTIHRSQGSEYPAVVIPLTTSAWMMLQRNLLYTGITRAKKLVVLAGSAAPSPPRSARRAPAAATPPSRTASRPAESRHRTCRPASSARRH